MDQPSRDARQNLNKRFYDKQFRNQPSSIIVNSPAHQFNVWDTLQNQPPFMQSQPSYTLVPTAFAQALSQLQLGNSIHNSNLPISYNSQQFGPNQTLTPNGSLSISYNSPQYAPNQALTPNSILPISYNSQQYDQKESVALNDSLPISYNSQLYAPNEPVEQNDNLPISYNSQLYTLNEPVAQNDSLPISYNSQQYAPSEPVAQKDSLPISYNSQQYAPSEPVAQNDSLPISYNSQQYAPSEPVAQNDSLPISYNSQQYAPNQQNPNRMSQNVNSWKSNRVKTRYGPYRKNSGRTHDHSDLRKKLIRRKSCSETFSANEPHDSIENRSRARKDKNKWNNGQEWEDTSVQMNLTPLKELTSSGTGFDQWYIVVDTDVILNNFIYLVNMTAADPNFHLLIPHHVMSELQAHVAECSNVQDRRTLRFLKDQINSGQAIIGDEEEAHESATYMSVMTCINLSCNHNVILITNIAEKLKSYVFISKKINIFSIQEVKDILAKRGNWLPKPNSPALSVKITTPNDVSGKLVAHEDHSETLTKRNWTVTDPLNNENASGVKFVENSQAGTQSSEKSVAKDLADTGVGTTTDLVNSKDDCHRSCTESASPNQSSPKSAGYGDHNKNENPNRHITATYYSRSKNQSQSPTNSANNCNESASTARYCTRSKSQNQSPNNNLENNKIETAIPAHVNGDSSPSSSLAASGCVSLDTIRIKNIISMKRLTSTQNYLNAQKKQPESITSTGSSSKSSIKSTKMKLQTANCTSVANIDENIITEETSRSGVISNSESSHSKKGRSAIDTTPKKVALKTVVMFGISCQSMEEVLKTRWDEWVFRFVQIMEETLRVKLHEKLAYDNKEYPAPRNLQEATRCIIKKYSNNFNIVDAANKLSLIIYNMSDEHGNMVVNMEPVDFMQMYSYGVFLVDTFQEMCADCKEIDCKKERTNGSKEYASDTCSCFEVNAAKESLKKLLFDIQNAQLQTFVGDRSSDTLNPDSDQYDYEISIIDETQGSSACNQQAERLEEMQCEDQNGRNLRNKKINETQYVPAKDSLASKSVVKEMFFNSLQLHKTFDTNTPESPANANEWINNNTQDHSPGQERTRALQNDGNISNFKIHFTKDDVTAKSQSKVVRTFTVNDEFERKLKERQNKQQNYEDDIVDDAILAADESEMNENNEDSDSESNRNFKRFMGRLVRILGAAFTQVHYLCNQCIKTVQGSNPLDISTKNNVYGKMDIVYSLIIKIHLSLDRLSKREQDKDNNIQMLLKIAKVEDFVPDDKLCMEYMTMIESCKKTAAGILINVQDIMKLLPE